MLRLPDNPFRSVLAASCVSVFRPMVKLLLRFGVSYKACTEWLRWTYVDVAMQHFRVEGRKQSKSRVSILTGLSRVEVDRMLKSKTPAEEPGQEMYHRAARVLTGWAYDPAFLDAPAKPALLAFEGESPSFSELVEKYAGGAPPRAVLDELLRVGSVSCDSDRSVQLISSNFVAEQSEDDLNSLKIMGLSTSRLLETIEYNLDPDTEQKRLQLLAFSRRIPPEKLGLVQAHIMQRGRELINEIDEFLFSESIPDSGLDDEDLYRAGMGIYYFEDDQE